MTLLLHNLKHENCNELLAYQKSDIFNVNILYINNNTMITTMNNVINYKVLIWLPSLLALLL